MPQILVTRICNFAVGFIFCINLEASLVCSSYLSRALKLTKIYFYVLLRRTALLGVQVLASAAKYHMNDLPFLDTSSFKAVFIARCTFPSSGKNFSQGTVAFCLRSFYLISPWISCELLSATQRSNFSADWFTFQRTQSPNDSAFAHRFGFQKIDKLAFWFECVVDSRKFEWMLSLIFIFICGNKCYFLSSFLHSSMSWCSRLVWLSSSYLYCTHVQYM